MADYAFVKDENGLACGIWLLDPTALDLPGMVEVLIVNKGHDHLLSDYLAKRYRIVPNTFNADGGCFVMFGSAPAPGETQSASPQPAVPRTSAKKAAARPADKPDHELKSKPFDRHPGSGVCDVCNRSIGRNEAYLVPTGTFYASKKYQKWLQTGPFAVMLAEVGGIDDYISASRARDTSEFSAVCPDCIWMFVDDAPAPASESQVSLRALPSTGQPLWIWALGGLGAIIVLAVIARGIDFLSASPTGAPTPSGERIATTSAVSAPPMPTPVNTTTPTTPTPSSFSNPDLIKVKSSFPVPIPTGVPLSARSPANGLASDGVSFWITLNSGKLMRVDQVGTLLTMLSAPQVTPLGLAWDGRFLWMGASSDTSLTRFIYEQDTPQISTAIHAPMTVSGGSFYDDLAWDGEHLWYTNDQSAYVLDESGSVLSAHSFEYRIHGIDWDGSHMWLGLGDSFHTSLIGVAGDDGAVIAYFISPVKFVVALAWVQGDLFALGRDSLAGDDFVYRLDVSAAQERVLVAEQSRQPAQAETVGIRVLNAGIPLLEEVRLESGLSHAVALDGWTLSNGRGDVFTFPSTLLLPKMVLAVHTSLGTNTPIDLYWGRDTPIWQVGDTATLIDSNGKVWAQIVVAP